MVKRHHENQPESPLAPVAHCDYQKGACALKDGGFMKWEPAVPETCQYISFKRLSGKKYQKHWIADDGSIALTNHEQKVVTNCKGQRLQMSEQGIAYTELNKPSETMADTNFAILKQPEPIVNTWSTYMRFKTERPVHIKGPKPKVRLTMTATVHQKENWNSSKSEQKKQKQDVMTLQGDQKLMNKTQTRITNNSKKVEHKTITKQQKHNSTQNNNKGKMKKKTKQQRTKLEKPKKQL